ncbi:cyclophilin-like family protein [Streptomyces sp. NPDC019507]|uniref:cyclophilin-like family protein n=1 Tax=Streptomyces sp. NPDC019507 TaxID=3154689 RepID=UPI00340D4249
MNAFTFTSNYDPYEIRTCERGPGRSSPAGRYVGRRGGRPSRPPSVSPGPRAAHRRPSTTPRPVRRSRASSRPPPPHRPGRGGVPHGAPGGNDRRDVGPSPTGLGAGARHAVEPGTVAFRTKGYAPALSYGPTPVSLGDACRPASPCNILGRVDGDPRVLATARPEDPVHGELATD